ncbi:MAG: putative quinol monooxygenase [Rikenellaceae bacterium]
MKRINAFFQVNEGSREQFLAVCEPLVAASQQEAGCIAYDLFASTTRGDVFLMCETWKDAEAIELHNASAHFQTAIAQLGDLCTSKIEVLDM